MKRVVHYKVSKSATIGIMASGLTKDEIGQIENLIQSIARKRRHGKRPQLLYDLVFNDQSMPEKSESVREKRRGWGGA